MKSTQEKLAAGRRLKAARRRVYKSARAAALDNEWSEQTVRSHENGSREFNEFWAKRYGRRYGASWLELLHGPMAPRMTEPPADVNTRTVKLAGLIGAGAAIYPLEGDGNEWIEAPPGIEASGIALRIEGESQLPVYHPGDVVFCESKREGGAIEGLVGLPCAVQVLDGPFLFKIIVPGSKKRLWTLLSHNAEPILDQQIEWAAFAEWHRVAKRRQRGLK